MPTIDEIIKREVNPFDPTTFTPGNFWHEKQDATLTVDSIHQEAITNIENLLAQVAQDHISRTILLSGDSGSGKSYLLGRLKRTLNSKAFFAYIGPWPDNSYIRRHILRYTVDSLTQIPENQQESQLILWLKSLSAFTKSDKSIWEILCSNRQKFINHLKKTYQKTDIYNAEKFFGVLHDLTNPELSDLAYEWLRGDELSEESLNKLKLKHSIESEEEAWETFANLGRISTETQPIVLCFDQLEASMKTDPQSIFNINTNIHNQKLKNFLVIISLTTDIYKQVLNHIQKSDIARINKVISLKPISLEQAETLWKYRLLPIHRQADSPPDSSIFPLTRQALEVKFPGGKTNPRNTLELGRIEYQKYKDNLISTKSSKPIQTPQPQPAPIPAATPSVAKKIPQQEQSPLDAAFKLIWNNKFKKAQEKYTKLTQLSAPELIKMLQDALTALEVKEIKHQLLEGKFSIYSFSYQKPGSQEKIGVIWTENAHMKSFYSAMVACEKALNKEACNTMILIREERVGNPDLKGYKIYQKIFKSNQHRHIIPTLTSVHYLATYQSLVNLALADELVISGKAIAREQLEEIVRQTDIFSKCPLLQELDIVTKTSTEASTVLDELKDFLLNFCKIQGYLGKNTLVENSCRQFPEVNKTKVEQQIQELIKEGKIRIVNPNAPPKNHLICYVLTK